LGSGPGLLLHMGESQNPRILLVDGLGPATQVASGREALAALSQIDVVLLDQQLPDTSGLDVLDAIRSRPAPPAVVLITAHGNESLAAAALRRGADDYLAKDSALSDLLPQILERVRRTRELRKALAAAEQDLMKAERLAAIGEMTVTLHHEINNPLMAGLAEIELLLSQPDATVEQQRQGLTDVRQALYRIRDIVLRIGKLREARSKDYLRGVQMLDLERPTTGEHPVLSRGTALIYVPDEDLARVVSLLMRAAGFRVERSLAVGDLQSWAKRIGITVVLLAGGADTPGAHPLEGFDPDPDREYLVVALVSGGGSAASAAGADHVVHLPFDPGTFTSEILRRLPPA
jgi:DNA-binding response OmpR family regulator